jgi:ABC-type polysaccharide/polyol phosphate export permease
VFAHCVSFAAMLVLLLVINFVALPRVRATEWLAIPLALLFVGLVSGLGVLFASLNVLFRDVEFIVAALLVPWFFLTPILYGLDTVSSKHQHVAQVIHWVNPLSPPVEAVRAPLFNGDLPFWGDFVYLVVACVLSLALGAFVFTRVDDQIAIEV